MSAQRDNTLGRLGGYVFSELDRLDAMETGDAGALEVEIARAKAVEKLVKAQVEVANTTLETVRLRAEFMASEKVHVPRELLS